MDRAGAQRLIGPAKIVLGIALALLTAIGLVLLADASPWEAARGLVEGAFGDKYRIGETFLRATPLAIVALGVAPALRTGIFSIGSEGQLAVGAITSTAVILGLRDAPGIVLILVGALAGAAGGAAWAFIPALMRARWKASEILATLLLNYLAGLLLLWLLRTHLGTSENVATPRSDNLPKDALLPKLLSETRLHWGIILVPFLALGLAWWVRSGRGLAHDVYSTLPGLGARMGVRDSSAVLGTMVVSGACAGLAGWLQVAGVQGTLYPSVAGGLGFIGVLVALLGGLKPMGIIVAAFFFGALSTGADGVQAGTGVPASLAIVLQGGILLAAGLLFAARARRVRRTLMSRAQDPADDTLAASGAAVAS
ncbi:MAG: hypothetical protein RL219_421 [Actinomycetota bacterium]|jgi:simple sugar transport system permease protein